MSEKDELNTAKLDINLTEINKSELNTFLQEAYGETAKVSHNNNCTFHSMGQDVWGMYLEDKKDNVENGLGERIIKKLIQKHGNKLKNPIWAHAGWHPFGSFAYRKSFLESVKYYFSNATFGWLNIFNPFFWLAELIWGEYENDFYVINGKSEIELHIDKNLSEKEKYRIGNILGQLIREEIADAITGARNCPKNEANLETSSVDNFVNLEQAQKSKIAQKSDKTDKLKIDPKVETKLSYKRKMTQYILDVSPGKKFDVPYVDQGSKFIVYEWQYLTSNDFLEETNENNPLETIVLEVNEKPISAENAKLVFSGFDCTLYFNRDIGDIKKKLGDYNKIADRNKLPLICVIGKGYFIGRCQPVVGNQNKQKFINNLLTAINEACGDSEVYSVQNKIETLMKKNENEKKNINDINKKDIDINKKDIGRI